MIEVIIVMMTIVLVRIVALEEGASSQVAGIERMVWHDGDELNHKLFVTKVVWAV